MKCFVIMPFKYTYNGVWESIIKPTLENLGHQCVRADSIFEVGSILSDIIKSIEDSDYIIADISEHNPNVFYELGYAHALNKKVILITRDVSAIPFDLKQQRAIVYSDTASGGLELSNNLKLFINQL